MEIARKLLNLNVPLVGLDGAKLVDDLNPAGLTPGVLIVGYCETAPADLKSKC